MESFSAPVWMARHSWTMLARGLAAGKASALPSFKTAARKRKLNRWCHQDATASPSRIRLFFQCGWSYPESQAVQPVRKHVRLCVRAGFVEPVDDGLDRLAVTPCGVQQSLRRIGVLLVMSA
jgi:hypothetical protein